MLQQPGGGTLSPAPVNALSKPHVKTKAALLAEWRAKNGAYRVLIYWHIFRCVLTYWTGKPHLPEHLLLRDTLYLLQGISGKYVQFLDRDDDHRIVFAEDPVR